MAGSIRSPRKLSGERGFQAALAGIIGLIAVSGAAADPSLLPYTVVGDAIPVSLTGKPGDAARGRAIVGSRQTGLCLLCHSGPFPEDKFQGTLAPNLAGAASRWSEGELRLRVVDARRFNPDTIMPPYYGTEGLTRVAPAFAGKPVLSAAQIEDVIAFLVSLRQ